MKGKRRTIITVETQRTVVLHTRTPLPQGWCARCGKPAWHISLEALLQAGMSLEAVSRLVEQGRLHLSTVAHGVSFVHVDSLLQQFSKGDQLDENPYE